MLGLVITRQVVFDGLVIGFVYGLLAMGIVLVYRATRVINFAVGNIGLVGAGLVPLLVLRYDIPYWLALAVALLAGLAFGAVVELAIVRRLFDASRVTLLVATIGISQLALAALISYPRVEQRGASFPVPLGSAWDIADTRVTGPQVTILLVVPAFAIALTWFLERTVLGSTVQASAENRAVARLVGINPKVVSTFVWATAGLIGTTSIVLVAGTTGSINNLDALGPNTLVRALAAAVVAGMFSFRRAFAAGIVIGIGNGVLFLNYLDQSGLTDFVLFVAVLGAVYVHGRRHAEDGEGGVTTETTARAIPETVTHLWWVRHIDKIGLLMLAVLGVALPLAFTENSRILLYTTMLTFAVVGMSLTILTGWLGQLSLGQMAFAGIGAFLATRFHDGLGVNIGRGDLRIVDTAFEPFPMAAAVVLAAIATAGVAALIGAGALRVRGLFLAVSTFAFAMAATSYLYRRPLLRGEHSGSIPFRRTEIFGLDLGPQRTWYYMTLAVLAAITVVVARLRTTGVARTSIAVRDNPASASAYTVNVARTQVRAFALGGATAAIGGALLGYTLQSVPNDRFFTIEDSLLLVALVVIGGVGSVSGPILGAIWVIGVPAFFPDNEVVPLLVSGVGLLVLLLYLPGGLVQLAHAARAAIINWAEAKFGRETAPLRPKMPDRRMGAEERMTGGLALSTEDISVSFGGVKAVDDVAIEVAEEEVVGLIGTNGAGKSTLMNAIGGFVPSTGSVELFGADATRLSSSKRAAMGLGRTFQAATLFPGLTVEETVQVALEARERTGLLSSALGLPKSVRIERSQRSEAAEIIGFLGLGRYRHSQITELSTGTRRIVELACLIAVDARVLCLDEPTAGVAQREAEAFGPLLLEIRRELRASLLVIEHDMPLIMSISDRVYCLEAGAVIAAGPPDQVRASEAVISSYLGTDERAIERSDSQPDLEPTTGGTP